MLMDAPPSAESPPCDPAWDRAQRTRAGWNAMARLAGGRVEAYAAVAGYLRGRGLSAPEVLALDVAAGLAVSEDFGDGVFARLMEAGADEAPLYGAAVEALARLHEEPPPPAVWGNGVQWPLLDYDAMALKAGCDLFVQWYPALRPDLDFGPDAVAQWDALWSPIVDRAAAGATVFAHRDFHAENLLWLDGRAGIARAGVIDFSGRPARPSPPGICSACFRTPGAASPPDLEAAMLDRYLALRPAADRHRFRSDYAALAALQRGPHPRRLRPADPPRRQAAVRRVHSAHVASSAGQSAGTRDDRAARLVRSACAPGPADMTLRTAPATALVLAAGLGTRMRPLTDDRPKALVEVGGRALIDHMIDRLVAAGVTRVVVNVHAFADRLQAHLAQRGDLAVVISDERDRLLETGGGLKKARALVGEAPIWVANIDSVWIERGAAALPALAQAWDPERMDDCLLLARAEDSLGLDGSGDFFRADDGALALRGDRPSAPLNFMGVHIVKPQVVDAMPPEPFSMMQVWKALIGAGRLHGAVMDALWMHVGDPAARDEAEARLKAAGR